MYESSDINMKQMETLIKQGTIVIDVRSPQEFAEGHIPGAICIPEYNIQREIRNKSAKYKIFNNCIL